MDRVERPARDVPDRHRDRVRWAVACVEFLEVDRHLKAWRSITTLNRDANLVYFQALTKERRLAKARVLAALNEAEEPIRIHFAGRLYRFRIGIGPEVLEVRRIRRKPRGRQGC